MYLCLYLHVYEWIHVWYAYMYVCMCVCHLSGTFRPLKRWEAAPLGIIHTTYMCKVAYGWFLQDHRLTVQHKEAELEDGTTDGEDPLAVMNTCHVWWDILWTHREWKFFLSPYKFHFGLGIGIYNVLCRFQSVMHWMWNLWHPESLERLTNWVTIHLEQS